MGKGKHKKKSKKGQNEQLPTHLAGVPLPQNLREVAATAQQLVRHPVVSDIISAGVLAAIAALAENESVRRAARSAGDEAEDAAEEASRKASRAKVAVRAAAGAMGKRLLAEVKSTGGVKKSGKSARKEPAHAG